MKLEPGTEYHDLAMKSHEPNAEYRKLIHSQHRLHL